MPFLATQIGRRDPGLIRLGDAVGVVVPSHHIGSACNERLGGRQSGAAQPEECDLPTLE